MTTTHRPQLEGAEPSGRRSPRFRGVPARIGRVLLGTGSAALVLAVVVGVGGQVTAAASVDGGVVDRPAGGWPTARASSADGDVVVAVVLGQTGTDAADVLAPYEVFARAAGFSVYTVAEQSAPVPLSGGTSLVPVHTFADVDSGRAASPDVVVVPAVSEPTGAREAAARSWIVEQSQAGAWVMGVCSGAEVLAATGLLDGHRATSHWSGLASLRDAHPEVDWVDEQRWVQDGKILTTAGVSSGIPGALEMVRRLAGPAEAARVGQEVGYPGWELGGSTGIPAQRFTPGDLPLLLNAVLPWFRPTVALGLTDGVGEIDVAAALDVYSTSGSARTFAVAAAPAVTTLHGVVLTASTTGGAPGSGSSATGAPATSALLGKITRLVAPGAARQSDVDPALAQWAQDHGLPVEPVGTADGTRAFDATLQHVARHQGGATARSVAKMIDYPTSHLALDLDDGVALRAPVLAVSALLLAAGAGLVPTAARRALRRRRVSRAGAR